MTENQKLREALQELHDVFCEDDHSKAGRHRARLALIQTRQALATTEPVMANGLTEAETDATASVMGLATTEPEPTGMPELPEPDLLIDADLDSDAPYRACSVDLMRAYGEQCWKAGYKHGAWGDKPAVNQQLTTEPFDEREAFESEMIRRKSLSVYAFQPHPRRGEYQRPYYLTPQANTAWAGWQARAEMAQVGDINVVESFTNDTKDAERYRWLRDIAPTLGNRAPHVTQYPGQSFDKTTYLDATKVGLDAAIDAAMAQGVK